MEEQQNNSSLKTIIAVLAVLLVGSLIYIFQISDEVETTKNVLKRTLTEKETMTKDLEALKLTYDAAIESAGNEKSALTEELTIERDKVVALMSEISKSKGDLSKYKKQFLGLQTRLKELMIENEQLKVINTKVTAQRDSTSVVLIETRKKSEEKVSELSSRNQELSSAIEKGAKLSIVNLKVAPLEIKKASFFRSKEKQEETDKASKTNKLKVSFTIAENSIAKAGDKFFYVQIIDPKNNVLGDRDEITVENKVLKYSFEVKAKYENKTINLEGSLLGSDFAKGSYFVNVFDQSALVSSSSFDLK